MNNITLTVNKQNVYDEIAKTTAYVGTKMTDDKGAYDRIFTTEADRLMLERFWIESCNEATEEFKPFIQSVSEQTDITKNYTVELELSGRFDTNLKGSMESSLFSFFVATIVGKWCKFTDKGETGSYLDDARKALMDIRSKMYYRKKPTRVAPV
ncbi:MAG: hypothetical protein MSS51_08590 [Bacteroidales bacterium]|nr:hypothetical protein [Bacteroidales bacterium]